jgi:hypothetical protein
MRQVLQRLEKQGGPGADNADAGWHLVGCGSANLKQ